MLINKFPVVLLLIISQLILFGFFNPSYAQSDSPNFQIGKFTIYVDPATILINGQRPTGAQWWNTLNPAGKIFAGSGYTKINYGNLPVKFNDIKLRVDNNKYIASSGVVSGTGNGELTYTVNTFEINIKARSLRISPNSSLAEIKVSLPLNSTSFARNKNDVFTVSSTSCRVSSDGSIEGNNFRLPSDFNLALKGVDYDLKVLRANNQQVRLSPASATQRNGIVLSGVAGLNSDNMENLFNATCEIVQNAKSAMVTLALAPTTPPQKRLEQYYREENFDLTLKSGTIRIKYGPDGTPATTGQFTADFSLPQNVQSENGTSIMLTNIQLDMDQTRDLFGNIPMQQKIKVGKQFVIEAASNAAVLFLPWHPLSRTTNYPLKPTCGALYRFLETSNQTDNQFNNNVDRRPGLTILNGILYFASPQIENAASVPQNKNTVKTVFSGGITVTPYGIAGELTSSGNTFIPYDSHIDNCGKSIVPLRQTWEQVTTASAPPQPIKERFTLAGLRILEMRVEKMRFCPVQSTEDQQQTRPSVELNREKTPGLTLEPFRPNQKEETFREKIFRYVVHFPYPSYINLDFQDLSLDDDGRFHNAKGPVAPYAWTFYDAQDQQQQLDLFQPQKAPPGDNKRIGFNLLAEDEKVVTKTQKIPHPDTYILWAWHLPVSFADRGVNINYTQTTGKETSNVAVIMDTTRKAFGEVLSSELWVRPLYSKNSAIKSGVRFGARLTAGGAFELTEWDKNPFFAKSYIKPTATPSERSAGFDCKLDTANGIQLPHNPQETGPKFNWKGQLEFPFFGWQEVSFSVIDLKPNLLSPAALRTAGMVPQKKVCPDSERSDAGFIPCSPTEGGIALEVNALKYSDDTAGFSANVVDVKQDNNPPTVDLNKIAGSTIDITSFTRSMWKMKDTVPRTFEIEGYKKVGNYGNCHARPKWIRQEMGNAADESSLIDLVCYDVHAMKARGLGKCPPKFMIGTYMVKSCDDGNIDASDKGCTKDEIITLSAPSAKYYQTLKKLELQNTRMALKSDEAIESHTTEIGIPGAVLTFDNEGKLFGAFGATLATVADALPYEGEFRFMLDPRFGYYYVLGAGSFTYYLRFSGATFVVHAPYKDLNANPFSQFMGVSRLLEDLRIRSLLGSTDEFTSAIGLPKYDDSGTSSDNTCSIITGLLSSGNARFSFGYGPLNLSIAAGAGNFLFQHKNSTSTKYGIGTYVSSIGIANLYALSLEIPSYISTAFLLPTGHPHNLKELDDFFKKSEFQAGGKIAGKICGSLFIGHCEAGIKGEATYSTKSGLDLSGSKADAHCQDGGCCTNFP